jgi:hypothetical protein
MNTTHSVGARCSDSEEANLTLGMRASKLDDRESLANLVSSGDVKQALRSLVRVLRLVGTMEVTLWALG